MCAVIAFIRNATQISFAPIRANMGPRHDFCKKKGGLKLRYYELCVPNIVPTPCQAIYFVTKTIYSYV